jgi:hypothetical protein
LNHPPFYQSTENTFHAKCAEITRDEVKTFEGKNFGAKVAFDKGIRFPQYIAALLFLFSLAMLKHEKQRSVTKGEILFFSFSHSLMVDVLE